MTGILLAAAAGAALLLPGSPAIAKPLPVVYANGDGWRDPSRMHADFFFGGADGPYVKDLAWSYWGSHGNAYGQGRLETQNPACTPSALCPYHGRWISIFLRDVRTHGGRRYFAGMTVRFRYHGSSHRQRLTFEKEAPATIPSWHGPLAWPWL